MEDDAQVVLNFEEELPTLDTHNFLNEKTQQQKDRDTFKTLQPGKPIPIDPRGNVIFPVSKTRRKKRLS